MWCWVRGDETANRAGVYESFSAKAQSYILHPVDITHQSCFQIVTKFTCLADWWNCNNGRCTKWIIPLIQFDPNVAGRIRYGNGTKVKTDFTDNATATKFILIGTAGASIFFQFWPSVMPIDATMRLPLRHMVLKLLIWFYDNNKISRIFFHDMLWQQNLTELCLGSIMLYNLRVVERLFGTQKFIVSYTETVLADMFKIFTLFTSTIGCMLKLAYLVGGGTSVVISGPYVST